MDQFWDDEPKSPGKVPQPAGGGVKPRADSEELTLNIGFPKYSRFTPQFIFGNTDLVTVVPPRTGSASGTIGFSSSAAGKKLAASTAVGSIGVSDTEAGRKGATSSSVGALGIAGSEVGAEHALHSVAGRFGLAASEVSKRGAIAQAVGSIGFSSDEHASRKALSSSAGALGFSSTAIGGQIRNATGSVVGAFGFSASAVGATVAAAPEVPEAPPIVVGEGPRRLELVYARGRAAGAIGITGTVIGVARRNWKQQNELALLLIAA